MNKDILILIVDDEPNMLRLTKLRLKELGFENVIEATDGEGALQRLSVEKVDLIISDWKMPDMDGLKLLQMLRTNKKYRDIPFLMVTSSNQKNDIIEAAKSGVRYYVVKPFDRETLEKKLQQILGVHDTD